LSLARYLEARGNKLCLDFICFIAVAVEDFGKNTAATAVGEVTDTLN